MNKTQYLFIFIVVLTIVCGLIALPEKWQFKRTILGKEISLDIGSPVVNGNIGPFHFNREFKLKKGLDIQGGMQVVLDADMSQIAEEDRERALQTAQQIIIRRVDLYGINEPVVQTAVNGDQYRILVELAGVTDSNQALQLLGTTAQLDFRLQDPDIMNNPAATTSADVFFSGFTKTDLSGSNLKRSTVQFDKTTGEPVILLEFDSEGAKKFADITRDHQGEVLAIFIDDFPITMPTIQSAITNGQAQLTGGFTVDSAEQLSIQLNAGALPVPIQVVEQRTVGASLGQQSVDASLKAGLIGIGLVMTFMTLYYGTKGFLASLALCVYAVITVAIYKIMGVTLTLPGMAGLLLSIGMAVDANILIFERMKEELRLGKNYELALELGFGRAWDSIKDANLATITTALILINPLNFSFLNTSGLVKGFGITLLIGVLISLFTGVVVTRTFLRLFLKGKN